jgi:hypothetical protein
MFTPGLKSKLPQAFDLIFIRTFHVEHSNRLCRAGGRLRRCPLPGEGTLAFSSPGQKAPSGGG